MTRDEIALSTARHVAGAQNGSIFIVMVLNPDGSASSFIGSVAPQEGVPMHALHVAGAAHLELSSLLETACGLRGEPDPEDEAVDD